jgi:hypothetical protein
MNNLIPKGGVSKTITLNQGLLFQILDNLLIKHHSTVFLRKWQASFTDSQQDF